MLNFAICLEKEAKDSRVGSFKAICLGDWSNIGDSSKIQVIYLTSKEDFESSGLSNLNFSKVQVDCLASWLFVYESDKKLFNFRYSFFKFTHGFFFRILCEIIWYFVGSK